ncbi:hypothetical protein K435DRAFT_970900 [Dendrothele bispora CBS 962.96]|uniref:F-box domain-containing protein n=1 Tax=Dendrothele bispora (strain CBS 962.96) TaxID=1314807 RepID=A0A4S8L957_DENBC|nr:hypothetical protein K435DRAFT_970900 [Dendrothele bispora CBS 962.96]
MRRVPAGNSGVLKPISARIPLPGPFPQELIDKIIDELQQDRLGLKACSLISHAWRPRAMYHFVGSFFLLNLRSHASKSGKMVRSLPEFIRFSSPPPCLASLITQMALNCLRKFGLLQDVMSYLHLYPNLRELSLEDVGFSDFSPPKIRTLSKALDRSPPPPLRHLKLTRVYFSGCEQFLSFISMSHFNEVFRIEMHDIAYGERPSKKTRYRDDRACSDCKTLAIEHRPDPGSDIPSFTMSLARREGYQSAGYPGIDIVGVLGESVTNMIVEEKRGTDFKVDSHLCPSLYRLTWTFHDIESPHVPCQLKEFASLNNLTHFRLGIKVDDEIIFHVRSIEQGDINKTMVTNLDKALAPVSSMPSLQKLTLPDFLHHSGWLIKSGKSARLVPEC